MKYVCEVESCRNKTDNYLCEDCLRKLKLGYSYIMCKNCNIVVSIDTKNRKKVVIVDECYNCRNKKNEVEEGLT